MGFMGALADKVIISLMIAFLVGLGARHVREQGIAEKVSQGKLQTEQAGAVLGLAQVAPAVGDTAEEMVSQETPAPPPAPREEEREDEATAAKENSMAASVPSAPAEAVSPPAPAPSAPFPFNPAWADAIVNLFCGDLYGLFGGDIASGSGVVIDPRGIILTNAHVGMLFLFSEWPIQSPLFDCMVRTGSTAVGQYRAALLHIPGDFVASSALEMSRSRVHKINREGILPNGKKDYALLYITRTTDPNRTFPSPIPSLSPYTGPIAPPGSAMYMAGYPGSFLGYEAAAKFLARIITPTTVHEVRPIEGSSTLDVLAFKGTVAGQRGTSGGAVVQRGGELAAVPTFFDEKGEWEDPQGETTADNILNAITVEYISRDLKADTGFSLEEFIVRDNLKEISDAFLSGDGQRYRDTYVDAFGKAKVAVPGVYR